MSLTEDAVDDKGGRNDSPVEAAQQSNGGHVGAEEQLKVKVNFDANEPHCKDHLHGVLHTLAKLQNAVRLLATEDCAPKVVSF